MDPNAVIKRASLRVGSMSEYTSTHTIPIGKDVTVGVFMACLAEPTEVLFDMYGYTLWWEGGGDCEKTITITLLHAKPPEAPAVAADTAYAAGPVCRP